jgi:hypothetical protein
MQLTKVLQDYKGAFSQYWSMLATEEEIAAGHPRVSLVPGSSQPITSLIDIIKMRMVQRSSSFRVSLFHLY